MTSAIGARLLVNNIGPEARRNCMQLSRNRLTAAGNVGANGTQKEPSQVKRPLQMSRQYLAMSKAADRS
jgi:hypothetical protein